MAVTEVILRSKCNTKTKMAWFFISTGSCVGRSDAWVALCGLTCAFDMAAEIGEELVQKIETGDSIKIKQVLDEAVIDTVCFLPQSNIPHPL
jgi:hypothetical protein